MRSLLTYTAARLGLFAAAFGVVYLFGARAWIALILAWLVSGLASYVLLSGMRDRISASAVERMERRKADSVSARLSAASAREDEFQEAPGQEAPGQEAPEAPEQEAAPAGADADAGEDRVEAKRGGDAPTAARES
ncbi:DUF4229 domain-containing protein [Nocardiopsis sp. HUAS JQ3]|uniref:DUF4229 domain-containing protein n=1 Tax=Nocardiopsis sp. HUAS JQ3 TaxID=3061629 RepID=UPI0023A9A668|nr:DUF4229 domain-containing protein [Nocardiopsis sp. HUAS JQ3]WDZ91548.1 DUF4229 domain-containing protein [Nocardiopsis sp. HUAS JQ3]